MELTQIQILCTKVAEEKGWMEKEVPIPEMVALLHSEISEALEAYRDHLPILFRGDPSEDKPVGIASEFADTVIRLCHYASILNFDLEAAVHQKIIYNKTRPHRHGGKLC